MDSIMDSETAIDALVFNGGHDEHEISFRCELRKLLNAISSEMCGEMEPGSQEFLEVELIRYKDFLMGYKEKAHQMQRLLPFQLRTHLLLNLQSDILKLLVEPDCIKPKED